MNRPWWYRVPPVAVVLITYAVTGALIFTFITDTAVVWAGGGLVLGMLAAFVQGAARAAYDERHR
ncbi:hypothetical protein ACFRCI_41800 [Streptomyces sp. NPDC056638]|uniref:hypothetical protein n=1 Tax=Streptomyces sp. NPDC056638 TaxID=3345887 RepID=UPI003688B6A4